jgi:hypothetical protein
MGEFSLECVHCMNKKKYNHVLGCDHRQVLD